MRELRLRTSLILLLVVSTTLAFAIIGGALLLFRLPQVEARTRVQLQERAENTSRLLQHFATGVEHQLEPLARLEHNRSPFEPQAYVDAVVGEGAVFEAVFIVDATGRVESLGLPPKHRQAATELSGADFSGTPLFLDARERARGGAATRAIWSDRYLSALAGKNTVGIALTVGGKTVIGEVSLERILFMLKEAASNEDSIVTIIDGNGLWLASTNPDPDSPGRFFNFAGLPEFQAAAAGRPLPEHMTLFGQRALVAAVVSPKLHWIIAAVSPAGWGNYSYRMTILLVIAGFTGSLLISLALAPFWAARMARPLKTLIDRAHGIIDGDYNSPWPRRGSIAELNQLSRDLERMVDVIQSREGEAARSEERLRATLESTPWVAIQWYDEQGQVLYWNKASESIYGFSAEEAVGTIIGDNELMFLHRKQAEDFVSLFKEITSTGQPFGPAEFPLRHKNGGDIVVLATIFAIPGDNNSQIFVCMDIDVTERKRADAALENSEKTLEAIFNASPAPMCVSDANNGYRAIIVNAAWEKLFRRQSADIVGRTGIEIKLWASPPDRERILSTLNAGGTVENMEVELLTGDGQPVLCNTSALITNIGEERLMLMVTVDITERRRIENHIRQLNAELEERVAQRTENLSQANEELEATVENLKATQVQLVQSEKLAALGNLVAGVAHELNTPIGNGLMAVSTLRERLVELREAMASGLRRGTFDDFIAGVDTGSDIAVRNLRRAAELVKSFKQVAVDQSSSQRRSFRLHEVVDEILMTLNPTLKRTPYLIETDIPAEFELDSYPGPLGQALTNLINNAVIHGFDERDHGKIRIVASSPAPGYIAISVCDDGKGIPPDRLTRIYEPFFTTRMGRGGTGLGLHVMHSLVTNVLGGTVSVNSSVGAGTEFMMVLPERAPLLATPVEIA